MTSESPRVHEIRLGLYATPAQAEEIKERITRLLCPEPEHAPPCPVPWSVSLLDRSAETDDTGDGVPYQELIDQARAEQGTRES
ncbi:hypothetical protein ACFYYS_25585 [Streptomyces sp. NPDC002120]|uniref:hypothetical protein n=1 Tax=unclassified Streptomyces TaxID=2593676 RepID=UPI003417F224